MKSNAHPDTLTDLIVEACAWTLDHYYKNRYGRILHYNVDKAVFLAGNAEIHYGGGKILKPPTFILGGQVSKLDRKLKKELVRTVQDVVHVYLPNLDKYKIEIKCGNVSSNLDTIASDDKILCNDSSFGVGYFPFSAAEVIVQRIMKELDSMIVGYTLTQGVPYPIGELYKILLTPKTITISAPLYAQSIKNVNQYSFWVKRIEEHIREKILIGKYPPHRQVIFNPDFQAGRFPYLTLTGSSIECGDDGQVGRGNRYNGLITPCRPMTMEAYSGKNNHNHIGKIYQRWACEEAKKISIANGGRYTEVILVGKIGQPIKDYEIYVNY